MCVFRTKFTISLKYLLVGGLLFLIFKVKAQRQAPLDTATIYSKTKNVPLVFSQNPKTLASFLTKNYIREDKKVLAISYWIVNNIQYDYKGFKQRNISQKTSLEVLRKKKALCREYALLFKEMCKAVGVQAEIVNGYTKGFDFFPSDTLYRAEHTWSIVRIEGVWHLMDLTYASGHITSKKQAFAKGIVQFFGGRLAPKFKYVQAFNPNWLFVPADEFIFTHYPNLRMYQLLAEPVNYQLYQEGGWGIHGHLSWFPKILKESKEIDRYIHWSRIEQCLFEAKEGHLANPNNHRVKGYHYYWALDSLFRAAYDQHSNGLIASKAYLKQMETYAYVAETALQENIQDNNQEYQNKLARSWSWKKRLSDRNQRHILQLKKRAQKNRKQELLVLTIEKNNLTNQQFTAQYLPSKQISKRNKSIKEVLTDTQTNPIRFNALLQAKLDSLEGLTNLFVNRKDSFLDFFGKGMQAIIFPKERLVLKIHKGNAKALKQIIEHKKMQLPLVYEEEHVLDKVWLVQSNQRVDSINKVVTDTFLLALYEHQIASYSAMKSYCELIETAIGLLETERQYLNQLQVATEKYTMLLFIDREKKMIEYREQLKKCLGFQQRLIRLLGNEIQHMENSVQTLQKENRLEYYRHKQYMEYRQHIRQTENLKTTLILQKITRIKRFIKLAQA